MANRKLPELAVTDEGRDTLERWARRRKSSQALAFRCRVVLICREGLTNTAVARKLETTNPTVGKWRQRFVENRLDGLMDEPRSGAPRTITDEQVEDVVIRTLETKPKDATHWSTRSMAAATGMTQNAIHRIWKAFALQPHRTTTFKLSKDPQFIEKVRDVVGLIELQTSVVDELNDLGEAIGSTNQSYSSASIAGEKTDGSVKAATSGSYFFDNEDICDGNECAIVCVLGGAPEEGKSSD